MGPLSHAPVPAPPAGTVLATCPLPRPSSPSADREQPAQRDPPPRSQPGAAPAAPSLAHPSPRRPPASPGARGRAGVSPARCWAAGRHRSGRGGCGSTWPGCPGWSGEAGEGKHHHVPPSTGSVCRGSPQLGCGPACRVEWVCPPKRAHGELEVPAGRRPRGELTPAPCRAAEQGEERGDICLMQQTGMLPRDRRDALFRGLERAAAESWVPGETAKRHRRGEVRPSRRPGQTLWGQTSRGSSLCGQGGAGDSGRKRTSVLLCRPGWAGGSRGAGAEAAFSGCPVPTGRLQSACILQCRALHAAHAKSKPHRSLTALACRGGQADATSLGAAWGPAGEASTPAPLHLHPARAPARSRWPPPRHGAQQH